MCCSLLQAIEVSPSRQLAVVADLLLMHKPRRAIVFTPTRGMVVMAYIHVHVQCNTIYCQEFLPREEVSNFC